MLIPGKLYKLTNILYPRPFIYFRNGYAYRCATKPGIDIGEIFLLVDIQPLKSVGTNITSKDKIGFKILMGTESGWIWFRETDPIDTFFVEVEEEPSCG